MILRTITWGPINSNSGTYPPPIPSTSPSGTSWPTGCPGPGAGNIETPGTLDVYSFTANPGQNVFFDIQAGASGSIDWVLTDAVGNTVFDTFLSDRGTVSLDAGGTYTLTIGDPTNDHMGTYQFQLWDVPAPDSFGIAIGDVVADGVPGPGAGNIETPGTLDVYTFAAAPGQTVLFDIQDGASGSIDWILRDEKGSSIFESSFSNDQTHTLTSGGSYMLRIGASDNDHVGSYQIQLLPQ